MGFEFLELNVPVNGEDVSLVGLKFADLVALWASGFGGMPSDDFIHVPLLHFNGEHLTDFVCGLFDQRVVRDAVRDGSIRPIDLDGEFGGLLDVSLSFFKKKLDLIVHDRLRRAEGEVSGYRQFAQIIRNRRLPLLTSTT